MSIFVDLLDAQGYWLNSPQAALQASNNSAETTEADTAKSLVRDFLLTIRSGKSPERIREFFADQVIAHQLESEQPRDVVRTPEDYALHVREFTHQYGRFEFDIVDLIADGDRVYARWTQRGHHLASIDGESPTGKPLLELASAVYRVSDGRIVEYWIQIDRMGLARQLQPAT